MLRIDTDGVPYWHQIQDTNVVYGFGWYDRLQKFGPALTVDYALLSTDTASVAPTNTQYASSNHMFHVKVSAGNVGLEPIFVSKVFLSDGQVDKARFRIKVID